MKVDKASNSAKVDNKESVKGTPKIKKGRSRKFYDWQPAEYVNTDLMSKLELLQTYISQNDQDKIKRLSAIIETDSQPIEYENADISADLQALKNSKHIDEDNQTKAEQGKDMIITELKKEIIDLKEKISTLKSNKNETEHQIELKIQQERTKQLCIEAELEIFKLKFISKVIDGNIDVDIQSITEIILGTDPTKTKHLKHHVLSNDSKSNTDNIDNADHPTNMM
jgi:hypothetical protein